jgi:beta-phosphoglucomutase-like phosphatase (HAD superfamily)
MAKATIDAATGCLTLGGQKVFPLILSDAPPQNGKTPDGKDAWAEIANDGRGANFIRSGRSLAHPWKLAEIDAQIAEEHARLDLAQQHGLHGWLRLVNAANLPAPTAGATSEPEQLLVKIATALKDHPALAVYKGADEPQHGKTPPKGLVRAREKLGGVDADHPIVIIQAPLGTVADLAPYANACHITGADIYPISYGHVHATDMPNKDISVVGDVTRKMVAAANGKPVWMTLQIAWSGVIPSHDDPDRVPRFPSLHDLRFMSYQAIIAGARGLAFFGGDYTQVMAPRDAVTGWNWTFWHLVLRPLLEELSSGATLPALLAPAAKTTITSSVTDVEVVTRRAGTMLYVIAVRRSATKTDQVHFSGLPHRDDGTPLSAGEVVSEYAQDPPSPPVQASKQKFRYVKVANVGFTDWLGPHDARVYRFHLA